MNTLQILINSFLNKPVTDAEKEKVTNELNELKENNFNYNSIAIEYLENLGYCLGYNLWHVNDVPTEGTTEQKQSFLNKILSDDYITQEINETIKSSI